MPYFGRKLVDSKFFVRDIDMSDNSLFDLTNLVRLCVTSSHLVYSFAVAPVLKYCRSICPCPTTTTTQKVMGFVSFGQIGFQVLPTHTHTCQFCMVIPLPQCYHCSKNLDFASFGGPSKFLGLWVTPTPPPPQNFWTSSFLVALLGFPWLWPNAYRRELYGSSGW